MSKETILKSAEDNNVKYVRLCFTDIHGIFKNVEIPVGKLKDALDNKIMFDGSSIDGFARIEEADMLLYPDLSSWIVQSWEVTPNGSAASLFCDIHLPDGRPFEGDPRYLLKQQLKKMEAMGYTHFNIGVEPEFFLFKRDSNGNPSLDPHDTGGYFDLAPVDLAENARRDIVFELQKIGFEIEASHHEVAPGQHEINFEYDNAIKACDRVQLFKWVVKNVARRHDLYATFMPKPIANINGSGMHTNCSLSNKDGNVFADPSKDMGLSDTAKYWIAGILEHAKGFTAITNPLVNSYKRLVPGFEAPIYIAYSDANRSALIRIPATRGNATRTEIRSVDATANPYLAMTVILASGLDGIERKLNGVKPVSMNLYDLEEKERETLGIEALPGSLKEALEALNEDDLIKKALGDHVVERYIASKEEEWKSYIKSVSEWELNRYLKTY